MTLRYVLLEHVRARIDLHRLVPVGARVDGLLGEDRELDVVWQVEELRHGPREVEDRGLRVRGVDARDHFQAFGPHFAGRQVRKRSLDVGAGTRRSVTEAHARPQLEGPGGGIGARVPALRQPRYGLEVRVAVP